MEWTTACPDWESRIIDGRSLVPCPPLFPAEAEEALDVLRAFRVVDVPGSPRVGEIARPWILDFAAAFFGAYDPIQGKRLIGTYYLKVPKKNWKSGIAAFLMGTLLVRNWRESGEFGIIAPTTEIANNAFGPLMHAVRKDEELSDLLQVQSHIRTITHRTTKSALQVVAADSDTVGGKKFIVTLVEELWQFGKRANADGMLLEATGGMASRDEGAVIYITTESDEPAAGVYKAKNDYARKVRDGEIVDPSFMPVMYEWPRKMVESKAYLDLANARLVNPNLGASVSEGWLRGKFAETKAESDSAFNAFLAKHLNVEIGVSMMNMGWAGAAHWEHQAQSGLTLDYLLEHSEVVSLGIDGGGLDDLLALCAVGRDKETRGWLVWTHAWAHKIVMERRKSEAARFLDFARDGDLTIVDEIGKDVEQLADYVARVHGCGLLDRIGVDQHGIGAIVEAITKRNVPQDLIIGISQGWKMVGAIKTAERKLAERTMTHGGQRMMAWCAGNAKIELHGNAISITKQASGTAKIDPLMALFDAVSLMALNPEAKSLEPTMLFFGGGRSTQPTNEARR